ncbi:MAG TPA: DUF6152 family protein [Nitrospira sp.]|nr:DUF6152 family protein [Nitrospira sp.]
MKVASFSAVVLLLVMTGPAMAHHGNAGYDMANMTTFEKATITEIEWTNPHCQIHFDVPNDKGVLEHWNVEAPPPSMLAPRDWTRRSLQAGEVVKIEFHAAKNGSPFGIIQRVTFPDGKILRAYPDR